MRWQPGRGGGLFVGNKENDKSLQLKCLLASRRLPWRVIRSGLTLNTLLHATFSFLVSTPEL